MNILSFSRMKSYNKDGKVRIILKLRLPRLDAEIDGADCFNGFYEKLAAEYINAASKSPYSQEESSRPTVVHVDFARVTDEYIAKHKKLSKKAGDLEVIKRQVKINGNGQTRYFECIDVYDAKSGLFVR